MRHYKSSEWCFPPQDGLFSGEFAADAYVMGYDTRPLLTLEEKGRFLERAVREEWVLFYEHDAVNECSTLIQTEKGVRVGEVLRLAEI